MVSYPAADAVYADENCDGVDGVASKALFVAASAPPGGDGRLESPFNTIEQALAVFQTSGKEYVLVAAGVYDENIVLQPGVQLHGGYSADFRQRNILTFPSEIRGQSPGTDDPPGTLFAQGISELPTIVSGFTVRGYASTEVDLDGNGLAAYAVFVLECDANLVLANNRVIGGSGCDGLDGSLGNPGFGSQSDGGAVIKGANGLSSPPCEFATCTTESRAGGAAGTNPECAAASAYPGGTATCPDYDQPSWDPPHPEVDGLPGYSWSMDSATGDTCGAYHVTEAGYPLDIKKLDGGNGRPGNNGSPGPQGTGCQNALGDFDNLTWSPGLATGGTAGDNGQFGGSGAPSGGIDRVESFPEGTGILPAPGPDRYRLGASGGGGGAAGCGGQGGGPGGTGGASVAVLVILPPGASITSGPTLRSNLIQRGQGGQGGNGAYGGAGGIGGDGGLGGTEGEFWVDFAAGNGGRGGHGGEGGGGGGGCGGASLGIVLVDPVGIQGSDLQSENRFLLPESYSTGGLEGLAGASGLQNPQAAGQPGVSLNYHEFY